MTSRISMHSSAFETWTYVAEIACSFYLRSSASEICNCPLVQVKGIDAWLWRMRPAFGQFGGIVVASSL
ncbi:protein of unknown function [Hyphomicrobium sp. MC1]|nr:protein of unknown function [Hyphomicrobium sp. MC1]